MKEEVNNSKVNSSQSKKYTELLPEKLFKGKYYVKEMNEAYDNFLENVKANCVNATVNEDKEVVNNDGHVIINKLLFRKIVFTYYLHVQDALVYDNKIINIDGLGYLVGLSFTKTFRNKRVDWVKTSVPENIIKREGNKTYFKKMYCITYDKYACIRLLKTIVTKSQMLVFKTYKYKNYSSAKDKLYMQFSIRHKMSDYISNHNGLDNFIHVNYKQR